MKKVYTYFDILNLSYSVIKSTHVLKPETMCSANKMDKIAVSLIILIFRTWPKIIKKNLSEFVFKMLYSLLAGVKLVLYME